MENSKKIEDTEESRKQVTFDLDIKALQTYYPKANWRNAYEDIKRHMKGYVLYALKLLEKGRA